MKCPNCGETSRIREKDKFCHNCGHNLKTGVKESGDIRIVRIDNRSFLQIGSESIEISDYNIKSSADGETELSVMIKGTSTEFELSTNLTEQM